MRSGVGEAEWGAWSRLHPHPPLHPLHPLARHSRSHHDNRHSYEAEDARGRARSGGALYYSPPGTSYTILERPASSHGHHSSYYQHKPARQPYPSSANLNHTATGVGSGSRHSTPAPAAAAINGKKRPISPEQVLRLFGQGGAAALGKAQPPAPAVAAPPIASAPAPAPRRHSPASSPGSTTHHAVYRVEPRPYSSGGAAPQPGPEPPTRTVTMTRDCQDVHGFGICVKGGKEAGVGVYISRVEEGSLAERAGLRPGDSILQVNGTPFTGIAHDDALKMLKSCRQLTMTVRTAGALSMPPRASCSWMDRYGRPASPPPPAAILPPPRHHRSASKDRSIRRVDLCIEPGQSLGLMIRGGMEYNLGIFITGVDKDSVADRAGLMVGDQILEVNGQSFVEVTHDEAVSLLKYHKRMSLLVRDVGKVPHACTAYGDQSATSATPRTSGTAAGCVGGPVSVRRGGAAMAAAATAVEVKARSLLPASELPALHYYMEEYAARRMPAHAFLTVLTDLLDTPHKYSLLTEIREFMLPEDRPKFDELIYRREEDLHHSKEGEELIEHRSPSEDSGLGLPPLDNSYRHSGGGGSGTGGGGRWLLSAEEQDPRAPPEDYDEEVAVSRRHSVCNSREGSTAALHASRYDDTELAHKLSRSFDMKEETGALLEDGSGMRRHQSMQRLQHDPTSDEGRGAKIVHDHHGNLRITVKKTKPILGIAIEGGANTKHPLPRIINIHEHGAAYEAGGLEVGQLILAVDGRRVDGMQHQEVARLIAESFAHRDKPEIEFVVVEAKKSNMEPKPTALIFLEA